MEASRIFQALSLGTVVDKTEHLLVSPKCLQKPVLEMIDNEIAMVKSGQEGYIGIKINSLTDKKIIAKLIEASEAGVKIDMVIRGICCLRSGIEDLTDNIRIISIVGRFLEHSRIYIFGTEARARIYIASADFMTRNTTRRVEVAVPIEDVDLRARIQEMFITMLSDNVKAREQQPDGTYVKVRPAEGQPPVDSQMAMFGYFQNGFVQETDKPEKPKAESKPKAAAVKAAVKPVPRQRAALRPKRAGLLQSLFGRGKK